MGLSCKSNIYVSWSTSELRVRLARRQTGLSPPVKIFTDHSKTVFFCGLFMLFLSCFIMLSCASIYWCLWSPAGKGLTSWLSFVMSNCEVDTFPLVSWFRCGAWLYRFQIFALHTNQKKLVKSNFLFFSFFFCSRGGQISPLMHVVLL